MAKINLVSLGHHHDHFWKLAQSLRSRSMDLRLWLSRQNDHEVFPPDFEVLTPFQSRSFKELSQTMARIMALPTQVFHVHCGSRMDLCDHLFYQLLKMMPQHRVILHLTDSLTHSVRNSTLNQWGLHQLNRFRFWEKITTFFCYGTDAITVENYAQLVWLHQSMRRKNNNQRLILPPLIQTHQNPSLQKKTNSPFFESITKSSSPIQALCVPLLARSIDHRDIEVLKIMHRYFNLFLFGNFEGMNINVVEDYRQIFETSRKQHHNSYHFYHWDGKSRLPLEGRSAFFIAGLDLQTRLTASIIEQALVIKKPLIFDTEQSMTYSGLWSHGKNCLIYDRRETIKHTAHIVRKLNDVPQSFFENSDFEFDHQNLDHAVNELSRVYQSIVR